MSSLQEQVWEVRNRVRTVGNEVTLYDHGPEFLPIGDSIGFRSNTSKLFKRWGLYNDLWAISCRAQETVTMNWNGDVIARDDTLAKPWRSMDLKVLLGIVDTITP